MSKKRGASASAERGLIGRLAQVRARGFADEAERDRPLFELVRGDHAAAVAALAKVRKDYYGHATWQGTRPFAVRAIAHCLTRPEEGRAYVEAMGGWFVGGSVQGHALALHALLGGYDRLEEHPPTVSSWERWERPPREPSDPERPAASLARDARDRRRRRNALLRREARTSAEVQLALGEGRAPSPAGLRDERLDATLGLEAALRLGDLVAAERFAKRLLSHRPSWSDAMYGKSDTRADGALGLARVHRRRGQHALVIRHVNDCLALASGPTKSKALLLGASVARELGLDGKAKTYLAALSKIAPRVGEVRVDELELSTLDDALGTKGKARRAVREGGRAGAAGEHDVAARAYERALGSMKRFDAEGRTIAARWLVSLALAGRFDALGAASERLLAIDPGFVSARESLAYASARLGRSGAARDTFRATGLARLFEDAWSFEAWSASRPERALSPIAYTAEDRAETLLRKGVLTEALDVLSVAPPLAPTSPLRFLIAGTIWNGSILGSPEARRASAEAAWGWLAPLAKNPSEENPFAVETPVLAAEILACAGRFTELAALPISDDVRSYPALTKRAYARLLPHLLDAHLALGAPQRVIDEVEGLFADREHERKNRTILERLVRAERALGREPTSLEGSEPDAEAKARELSNRAWAYDSTGDSPDAIDAAIESYVQVAEHDPSIAAIGLANAGNLARRAGRLELARALFDAALVLCSFFPFESRAAVLVKVGCLHLDDDPATALPLFALAFEAAPSAELAGWLAQAYDGVGDAGRAKEARALAASLDPRRSWSAQRGRELTTPKKTTSKKTTTKKTTTKETTAKKATAKKTTAKKTTAKMTTAEKATAKMTTAEKTTAKKTTAKMTTAKMTTAKMTTAKKTTAEKATPKMPPR
ncbi:MAG: histone H1-like repetitive region-containing protein [Myxococcales bacterium]|nr:histone H1-like repetitive region-containing protein [Myxococcales bacterium]